MEDKEIYNVLYTLTKWCSKEEEQTIVEIPQNMLVAKQLSNEYWGDAISIVLNIMNRCPMKSVKNNVPQEAWIGMKHSVFDLKFFGCIAYARISDELRKSLDKK